MDLRPYPFVLQQTVNTQMTARLNRRDFMIATAGIAAMTEVVSSNAASIVPTGGNMPQPVLPPTEQLMYSTVRLFNVTGNRLNWGTGFLFNLFNATSSQVPVIVTNRHVVESIGDQCAFTFTGRLGDGGPDLVNHVPIQITQFKQAWIPHPDVDLVIVPVGGALNQLQGQGRLPYFITLEPSLIPTDAELKQLLPVEQILTVGYPGLIWDDVHNLPVFHRGYTSTAPYIDFKGRKEFLIDIATWPGSSGSPVLLYNEGTWMERSGNSVMGGVRAKLLGVVYGVAAYDVNGNVTIQNAPTQTTTAVPTNLGACINASRILEFEPILVKRGVPVPPGYVMRAQ
jgi:hypothetical protein